jgi:hypothetical protein
MTTAITNIDNSRIELNGRCQGDRLDLNSNGVFDIRFAINGNRTKECQYTGKYIHDSKNKKLTLIYTHGVQFIGSRDEVRDMVNMTDLPTITVRYRKVEEDSITVSCNTLCVSRTKWVFDRSPIHLASVKTLYTDIEPYNEPSLWWILTYTTMMILVVVLAIIYVVNMFISVFN